MNQVNVVSGVSAVAAVLAGVMLGLAPVGEARGQGGGDAAAALEEVVVLGTRRAGRSALDSPVPVDVFDGDDFRRQGNSDMVELMRTLVPSFNVNTQPVSDASTAVRPINLRGLAPDHSLLLVNGKRRHRAAAIGWLTNGVSDGAQGPDISVIPSIAVKRAEVLRDGAAAQYGSDAIAGVMNFTLKDADQGGGLEAKYGGYTEEGEKEFSVAGNIGLPFTADGFFNASFEYSELDETFRAIQRADAQALIDAGNADVPVPAQNWGNPRVSPSFKSFVNIGVGLDGDAEAYAFGNYARKEVEGSFYWRDPHSRGGVFDGNVVIGSSNQELTLPKLKRDGDGRLEFDENGALQVEAGKTDTFSSLESVLDPGDGYSAAEKAQYKMLRERQLMTAGAGGGAVAAGDLLDTVPVGDRDGVGAGGACDPIRIDGSVARQTDVAAVEADENCESFITRFPGGFTPRYGVEVVDASLVTGLRGALDAGLDYDLSFGFGHSDSAFFMYNTINASLGLDTPTVFDNVGKYTQTEYNFNADVRYPVAMPALASDLNVAAGFEYRIEEFEITVGQEESWKEGDFAAQGFSVGTNGFPGFPPSIAGKWSRGNYAFYLDLEADVTDFWLLGAALRYEDFDTFGDTLNGKLATQIQPFHWLGLRAAWSSGFRAPTPGQQNAGNTTSAFDPVAGDIIHRGTIASTSAIAALRGGTVLAEEKSRSLSGGLVLTWQDWNLSMDYYRIALDDRIALTERFQLSDEERRGLLAEGVAMAGDIENFRFFQNAFDTTTYGLDVVATYGMEWGGGATDFSLAWNNNRSKVGFFNPRVISDQRIREVEESLPQDRLNFTVAHHLSDWRFLLRYNYVSGWYDEEDDGNSGDRFDGRYDGYFTLDFELAYDLLDGLNLVFGGQNFTDEKPDEHPFATTTLGNRYSQFAPLGFNGAFFYGRIRYDF